MGPIVSQLPSKTGVERSNWPKAKILQRNPLWSKWEVHKQLLEQFGDVTRFLQEAATEKIAPNIVQDLLSDPESLVNFNLELAVTIDVGEHFVKATYFIEGDGPLVFSCYEKLKAVAEACQRRTFQMCVQWWLQLSMKIRIRGQRPWNREPRLVYSQRFSGF